LNEIILPNIEDTKIDKLAALGKGLFGMVPFAGSILSEIIGNIIPNQRIDRISEFLKILDKKLEETGKNISELSEKMEEGYVNLFEEGVFQSARASSTDRKEYIASILVNGLDDEVLNDIQKNIFLSILSQLNDIEIIILYSHTYKVRGDKDFFEKHKDILSEPFAHLGASQEVIDQSTIYKTHREKLVNLNLINKRFSNIKKGEIPEFDNKTGMMKANGYELTSLGRLFLKYIDLQDEI
jgi:hypothetical protein